MAEETKQPEDSRKEEDWLSVMKENLARSEAVLREQEKDRVRAFSDYLLDIGIRI
jgi:hypothetical protein